MNTFEESLKLSEVGLFHLLTGIYLCTFVIIVNKHNMNFSSTLMLFSSNYEGVISLKSETKF
jgi:hypothetical protein